jgi:hypothetical protein
VWPSHPRPIFVIDEFGFRVGILRDEKRRNRTDDLPP